MHLHILLAVVAMAGLVAASGQDDCERKCGNVSIPYPFGSSKGCYYDPDYKVFCNHSSGNPTLFFGPNSTLVITNISETLGELEIMAPVSQDCYNRSGRASRKGLRLWMGNRAKRIRVSPKNRFVAIGCDTHAYFSGRRGNGSDGTGCISTCDSNSTITSGSCSGVGCCEVAVPEGITEISIGLQSYTNHSDILDFNPCSYAFFVQGEFSFSTNYLFDFQPKKVPMLLEWEIGNKTCEEASKDVDDFLCKENSKCDDDYKGPGYRCRCIDGFDGNPYVRCKDTDECRSHDPVCQHGSRCINEPPGNYTCKCPKGYSGDGRIGGKGCTADQSMVIKIVVGSSAGVIFLIAFVNWLYFCLKARKITKLREKFFRQNGGIMLQERISGDMGARDHAKVFTIEELKVATNNYDESRIIGKGGFGTVYKGVLSDNRTVAIKKSKLADQTKAQIKQFINEVVILSQINHRNVVKLIGCCLETEVPLLVYEFIPNGTLSDHIHNKGKSCAITWDIRLRIATGTAEALSYLHSAASVPVIHRDVKPMNILLDDNYVAKVADFGASRLIPVGDIVVAE